MKVKKELLNPEARFNIEGNLYKISNEEIRKGDLLLDLKDCTFGIHDGKFGNRIAVRQGYVTELVEKKHLKKLIKANETR